MMMKDYILGVFLAFVSIPSWGAIENEEKGFGLKKNYSTGCPLERILVIAMKDEKSFPNLPISNQTQTNFPLDLGATPRFPIQKPEFSMGESDSDKCTIMSNEEGAQKPSDLMELIVSSVENLVCPPFSPDQMREKLLELARN